MPISITRSSFVSVVTSVSTRTRISSVTAPLATIVNLIASRRNADNSCASLLGRTVLGDIYVDIDVQWNVHHTKWCQQKIDGNIFICSDTLTDQRQSLVSRD